MQQAVAASTARRRFQTTLLTTFGVIALLLALIGLFGVLDYSVRRRVPEIDVRMALGATRVRVIGMVVPRAFGWCFLDLPRGSFRRWHGCVSSAALFMAWRHTTRGLSLPRLRGLARTSNLSRLSVPSSAASLRLPMKRHPSIPVRSASSES
jgi:hypothetical protein